MDVQFRKKTMDELERLSVEEFRATNKIPIVIILDEVRSMHNVGSVFRTADGFSIAEIILCGLTPQPPHRDIQKTALGATETVKWQHVPDTVTAIRSLQNKGYKIIAIEQTHHSTPLHTFNFQHSQPYALIFGHEVHGVSEEALLLCDHVIEIPQTGSKHSFNISVSAGIVLWEFAKYYL